MANEKRMISYDVLMKHLDSCIKEGKGLSKSICVAIKCFVEQMPTVDAVEVVHGRWVLVDTDKGIGVCSNCNRQDSIDPIATHCRFCGAKMDGGADA